MPRGIKLEFPGTDGLTVAGLLETPDSNPHAFALFAHCFTCGKDVVSASRIARALVEAEPTLRPALKTDGLLTRDSREVERKKYGQPGARKRFQFSKR